MGDTQTQNSDRPHTVVLVIDGLRASALGAYGNTAYETPSLDSLAVNSRVSDWCYADAPDLASIYAALESAITQYVSSHASLLVTDENELLSQPFARQFTQRVELTVDSPTANAESVAETTTAQIWASFAEAIAAVRETNTEERMFAWLHTRGMYGTWDAPCELYESLVEEDDPPVEPSIIAPEAWHDNNSSREACDERFSAGCRYAAQIMVLDRCLASWLDVVEGLFEGEDLQIVLVGLRGFPLGEHGRIGGVDERLYSEQQQVPLLARTMTPSDRFSRDAHPTTLSKAMGTLLGNPCDDSTAVLASPSGTRSVHSGEWFLRQEAASDETVEPSEELYVKPDDLWEQNDVASLRPAVVEELTGLLAPPRETEEKSQKLT